MKYKVDQVIKTRDNANGYFIAIVIEVHSDCIIYNVVKNSSIFPQIPISFMIGSYYDMNTEILSNNKETAAILYGVKCV